MQNYYLDTGDKCPSGLKCLTREHTSAHTHPHTTVHAHAHRVMVPCLEK